MIKSTKGLLSLSVIAVVLAIFGTFFHIEFTGKEEFTYTRILMCFATLLAVCDAEVSPWMFPQIDFQ